MTDWKETVGSYDPLVRPLEAGAMADVFVAAGDVVREGRIALVKGADLSDSELLEFSRLLGPHFTPVALPSARVTSAVSILDTEGEVTGPVNWHFDQSFSPNPPDWSLLYCREPGVATVPTVFCDSMRLLDSLSPAFSVMLRLLRAEHLAYYPDEGSSADQPVARAIHPVVISCGSQSDALYVAPATVEHFEGWSYSESRPILQYLYNMLNWPEFGYVHLWRSGDILIWLSRRFAHRALPFDSSTTRSLRRILGFWASGENAAT